MVRAGATAETARFKLNPTTKVFTEDGREVRPGSGEIGVVANGGMVPLGYYKDPEKSARTFREVNGVRYSFPGDMATVEADGRITLLGRGSNCINTGGEKVYPEEVEQAIKFHPDVYDVLVVGVPDETYGQAVAAVVQPRDGAEIELDGLRTFLRAHLSGYKLPRAMTVVPEVPRNAAGKAQYPAAKELALATIADARAATEVSA
jgi:3-oxocholest-4-en-26-oate---CoA ligase